MLEGYEYLLRPRTSDALDQIENLIEDGYVNAAGARGLAEKLALDTRSRREWNERRMAVNNAPRYQEQSVETDQQMHHLRNQAGVRSQHTA